MGNFNQEEYEIIDAHTHIFPVKISEKATSAIGDFYGLPMNNPNGMSEQLLLSGKKINVIKYLVCSTATSANQVESINNFIYNECNEHKEFLGFGTLHPFMDDIEGELSRIKPFGLRGIKLHPDFQRFDIDAPEAYKIYEQIEGQYPVLIHMGDARYEYSRPIKLSRVLKDFPRLQVIAAHFGGYQRWQEAEECLKHPNIRIDTSSSLAMISPEYAKRLVHFYGADNIFFGTDFPMWDHAKELERFFKIGLTKEENRKILSENFKGYFGL